MNYRRWASWAGIAAACVLVACEVQPASDEESNADEQAAASSSTCGTAAENSSLTLTCPSGQAISGITFASYGTPSGACGGFTTGTCNAATSVSVVSAACVGKASCTVGANNAVFGDPCSGTAKRLDVQAVCAATGGSSGSYMWGNVALGGGGFVSGVIASPNEQNVFYARTDVGGMYRWNDAAQSWVPLTDWVSQDQVGFLGVESVAVDPQAPGRVYALVGTDYYNSGKTAILSSTDHGDHFTITDVTSQFKAHGNGGGRQNGERLVVDPNLGSTLFCGTRRNGLFKSTNSGASWTRVTSFPVTTTTNDNGIDVVVIDRASGSSGKATPRIFAGVSRVNATNLYMSTDGGSSWNPMPGGPPTSQMPQRATLASNGMLYVTFADTAGPGGASIGGIWKYDTAHGTWQNVTPSGMSQPFGGISVDGSNPNHVLASTTGIWWAQPWGWGDRILVSSDGGSTWTDLIAGNRVTMDSNGMPWIVNHAIHWAGSAVLDPFNGNRAFVTSGNGVFGTSNLSATTSTWKFMSKGLEETVPLEAVSSTGGPLGVSIGDYDGFLTTNIAVSPPAGTFQPGIGSTNSFTVAGSASSIMVRTGASMYRTANGGTSWSQVTLPSGKSGGTAALSANGNTLVYTPASSSTTYRTTNAGGAWSTVTGLNFGSYVIGDPTNANKFYAYNPSGGAFFVSTNGGASFAQTTTATGGGSQKIRAVPGIEGDIWVALFGGGLAHTTNSGGSFTKLASVQKCDAVGFGKAAPGQSYPTVFIWGQAGGGATGMYRSTDQGASWVRINDDQHQFGGPANGQFILGDMNVFGRVYMSTSGRGTIYGEPM